MIVYVLRLKDNRFYIAKTVNIKKCYQEHMNGTACEWTKKYQPLIMEKIIPNATDEMVGILVEEYTHKYGADHVQSDKEESYIDPNDMNPFLLPSEPLLNMECQSYVVNMMRKQEGISGCYKCGRMGHHGWDCFANAYQ
jgi:hypothetical protein